MVILDAVKKGFGLATKAMGLVAILFIFNVVGNLISLPFTPAPDATPTPQVALPLLLISLIFIIISIFIQGGSIGLVRDMIKEGKMKLAAMPGYGMKYFLRLLLLGLTILAIVVIIALVAGIIIAVTAPLNNGVVTGIAVVVALIIAIASALYFFIPFLLAPYAIVCDELGVIDSIKKAIQVGRKPFGRVFSLLLLTIVLVLIALGIGFLVGLLVGLVSAALPPSAGKIVMIVISGAVNGYLGVVATSSFMFYYLSKKESAV